MKKILCLLFVLVLAACATPQMSPDQQNVAPISETNSCKFIKTAYFEVSHPAKMHYYAALNTTNAGGDSYKILTTGNDMALGMKILTVNIAIYKCK
jgi:hypothetical protein